MLIPMKGLRAHWSPENTAMHRILRVAESLFVDELDLVSCMDHDHESILTSPPQGIWNLCSAYSYCLCILGNTYVWHGRGSSEDERKVASTYAQSLTKTPSAIIELEEGAEDEMFWMILGNDAYANASYWTFKDQLDRVGSRIFSINASRKQSPASGCRCRQAEANVLSSRFRAQVHPLLNFRMMKYSLSIAD